MKIAEIAGLKSDIYALWTETQRLDFRESFEALGFSEETTIQKAEELLLAHAEQERRVQEIISGKKLFLEESHFIRSQVGKRTEIKLETLILVENPNDGFFDEYGKYVSFAALREKYQRD